MEERDARGRDRARSEARADEILSRLVVGDAVGGKNDGTPAGWEFEEELLDELADLERRLAGDGGGGAG